MTVQSQVAESAGRHREYAIVVNGTLTEVDHAKVTYEQVVEIAFPGPRDPNIIYSVAYRNADGPHGGSGLLVAGKFVEVKKKGTSFRVAPTTRS